MPFGSSLGMERKSQLGKSCWQGEVGTKRRCFAFCPRREHALGFHYLRAVGSSGLKRRCVTKVFNYMLSNSAACLSEVLAICRPARDNFLVEYSLSFERLGSSRNRFNCNIICICNGFNLEWCLFELISFISIINFKTKDIQRNSRLPPPPRNIVNAFFS